MSTSNKIRVNYVRRSIPLRGPFSTDDYNASAEELSVDLVAIASRWNDEAYPVLNSLPRGSDETRWTGALNVPDALEDGLDGSSILVDNSATAITSDGLFWHTLNLRPYTVKDFLSYMDDRITTVHEEVEEALVATSSGLSADQWLRLGTWVKDGTTSLATSVDGKASEAKLKVGQLILDIFNSSGSLGTLGTSGFTVEEMVDALCVLHGGSWGTDPAGMNHDALDVIKQTVVDNSTSYNKIDRTPGTATDLQGDLNRLRYEIAHIKHGTATNESTGQWDTSATDPVGGDGSLNTHFGYQGTGTASATNPHAQAFGDITNLSTELGFMNTFAGKSGLGSELPSYTSSVYVGATDNLEVAIGKLDAALNTHITNVSNPHSVTALQAGASVRHVYDFTGHTDVNEPITIIHELGLAGYPDSEYPLIQVVDLDVGSTDYGVLVDEDSVYETEHGIVTSDTFLSIEYIDADSFNVYTSVINGKIIAVF